MDGEELLRMKPREIKRLHLIRQALEQRISQKQAAEVAGLSPRQMRRLMKRVEVEGDRGILHRRRGKPSNRRIADKTKQKVLGLFEKHYADYGPTLASEKLHERHQIEVHPETLRSMAASSAIALQTAESQTASAVAAATELFWRDGAVGRIAS